MSSQTFKGYAIDSPKTWTEFRVTDFEPKRMEDYDVQIAVAYCGVCGSDVHTITGGWGEIITPLITGHEIAGKVTAVGPKVTEFKVGDRAGVGAQVWSCMDCNRCHNDNENYCPKQVDTYNSKYPHTGDIAHGGYSNGIRAHQQFVFPIPDQIEDKHAGPFMCAGLTVYSPLVRHGCAPGKKVGIVGMGGLGHFAVQFAAAMDANVTVFSSSDSKKEDATKCGAKTYINMANKDWLDQAGTDFDLIVSTRDVAEGFPIEDFLSIMNVHASFVTCGLPDEPLPAMKAQGFAANGCHLTGSHIGSKKEVLAMLKLAVEKNVRPIIQEYDMKDASKAVQAVKNNSVRYRAVLKCDL